MFESCTSGELSRHRLLLVGWWWLRASSIWFELKFLSLYERAGFCWSPSLIWENDSQQKNMHTHSHKHTHLLSLSLSHTHAHPHAHTHAWVQHQQQSPAILRPLLKTNIRFLKEKKFKCFCSPESWVKKFFLVATAHQNGLAAWLNG